MTTKIDNTAFENFCLRQLSRLGQMRGFPDADNEEAIADYLEAFRVAGTDEIVRRVIDNFVQDLATGSYCPTPADIRRACVEVRDKAQSGKATPSTKCQRCGGTGFAIAWFAFDPNKPGDRKGVYLGSEAEMWERGRRDKTSQATAVEEAERRSLIGYGVTSIADRCPCRSGAQK